MDKQASLKGWDRKTPSRDRPRPSFVLDKAVFFLGDMFGIMLFVCSGLGLFVRDFVRFVGWRLILCWLAVFTAAVWGVMYGG